MKNYLYFSFLFTELGPRFSNVFTSIPELPENLSKICHKNYKNIARTYYFRHNN